MEKIENADRKQCRVIPCYCYDCTASASDTALQVLPSIIFTTDKTLLVSSVPPALYFIPRYYLNIASLSILAVNHQVMLLLLLSTAAATVTATITILLLLLLLLLPLLLLLLLLLNTTTATTKLLLSLIFLRLLIATILVHY